ncbi:hypothetical protein AB6A40_009439, partial [Gnathostoma spinigerum]
MNNWSDREKFEKKPGGMCLLETDYQDENVDLTKSEIKPGSLTSLSAPIQDIIKMIFDVKSIKNTLAELELDMDKMPLGKLSKNQIMQAYSVLTELQNLIESGSATYANYLDASNRFYTYVPHVFGLTAPPL